MNWLSVLSNAVEFCDFSYLKITDALEPEHIVEVEREIHLYNLNESTSLPMVIKVEDEKIEDNAFIQSEDKSKVEICYEIKCRPIVYLYSIVSYLFPP